MQQEQQHESHAMSSVRRNSNCASPRSTDRDGYQSNSRSGYHYPQSGGRDKERTGGSNWNPPGSRGHAGGGAVQGQGGAGGGGQGFVGGTFHNTTQQAVPNNWRRDSQQNQVNYAAAARSGMNRPESHVVTSSGDAVSGSPVVPTSSPATPHSSQTRARVPTNPQNDMMNNPWVAHPCVRALAGDATAETINGICFEGLLQAFNKKGDLALGDVREFSAEGQLLRSLAHVVLEKNDLVSVTIRDISLRFLKTQAVAPKKPSIPTLATDEVLAKSSSISQNHGIRSQQKELVRWEPDEEGEIHDLDRPTDRGGWSAEDMFRQNEHQFGVKSSFDNSLAQYTVPLTVHDTDEGRRKVAEAQRMADEIEGQTEYHARSAKENSDEMNEEEAYSAVTRPGHHDHGRGGHGDFRTYNSRQHNNRHPHRGGQNSVIITRNRESNNVAPHSGGSAGFTNRDTPRFDAAPNAPPRFDAAPNASPRFDAAPNAPPRFDAAPNAPPRFDAAQNAPPRFEAAQNASPRFDAAPNVPPPSVNQARFPQPSPNPPKVRSFNQDYTRPNGEVKAPQRSPDSSRRHPVQAQVWTRSTHAPPVPNVSDASKIGTNQPASTSGRKSSGADGRRSEEAVPEVRDKTAPSPVSHRKDKIPHEASEAPSSAKPPMAAKQSQLNPEAKEFTPRPPVLQAPPAPTESPSPIHMDNYAAANYLVMQQQQQQQQQLVYGAMPQGNYREFTMAPAGGLAYSNAGNPYANYALTQTSPVGSPGQMGPHPGMYANAMPANMMGQQQMNAQFPATSMYPGVNTMVSMAGSHPSQRVLINPQSAFQEMNPNVYVPGYQMNMQGNQMNMAPMYGPILYPAQAPPGGPFQAPATGAGFLIGHHPGHTQHIPVSAPMAQMQMQMPGNYMMMANPMANPGAQGNPGGMQVMRAPMLHPHSHGHHLPGQQ